MIAEALKGHNIIEGAGGSDILRCWCNGSNLRSVLPTKVVVCKHHIIGQYWWIRLAGGAGYEQCRSLPTKPINIDIQSFFEIIHFLLECPCDVNWRYHLKVRWLTRLSFLESRTFPAALVPAHSKRDLAFSRHTGNVKWHCRGWRYTRTVFFIVHCAKHYLSAVRINRDNVLNHSQGW